MKGYMEVGERGVYDKKKIKCYDAGENFQCHKCVLRYDPVCNKLWCGEGRPDGKKVYFGRPRKYVRKEGGKR